MSSMDNPIYQYLIALLKEYTVSDFHLHAGHPLAVRVHGELKHFPDMLIKGEDLNALIKKELPEDWYLRFELTKDIDFAFVIGQQRFRASAFMTMEGIGLVLRVIVAEIPNIEKLGLPPAAHNVLTLTEGLVLVTGATGSGKSTSLAAMIDKINRTRGENIITVEDPIEYVHTSLMSLISQREVGKDTNSFATALKGALRQDPDIIMMG